MFATNAMETMVYAIMKTTKDISLLAVQMDLQMLTVPVSLKLVMVGKTPITKDVQQTFLKGSW